MKIKKTVTVILLMIMTLLQFSFVSANTTRTMDVTLKSNVNLNQLTPGATFELVVHMDNFQNIEKGIRYMQAQLDYDKTILE